MIESQGYKFILYEDGARELYSIADDPAELNDLSAVESERGDSMRDELATWYAGLDRWKRASSDEEVVKPSGEDEKLLQLLGYVE